MVIEHPFADSQPSGALLDLSHAETVMETPRTCSRTIWRKRALIAGASRCRVDCSLEPIRLENILPAGSKRRPRPSTTEEQ